MARTTHTTTHVAHPATPHGAAPMPLLLGGGLVALLLLLMLVRGSGRRISGKKLDPKQVEKAKKRYIATMDKRLAGNVEEYSVLLESRNLVTGFYEQKGQVTGARFTAKQANCKRCQALDGKEFSLLDPTKLAAATPPLHAEGRRGVRCVAALVPLRAEAERPKASISQAKSKR
ncbi:MAG TPA: hypothetical protein V6D05_10610 [Stenomitos sp.]